jgi:acyl-CoA synthetase (AMP-forming)/AMP-acid ligase II
MLTHPTVEDVAVIGIPNADLGEELLALVVLTDRTADPALLQDFCRGYLASYKCPRNIEVVSEIPRDPMGKVNKRLLRQPYWPTGRTIG